MNRFLSVVALLVVALGARAASSVDLVVCAPGYPGNTVQAQPTMDDFARNVEKAAGWKKGRLRASYHESAEGGTTALASEGAAVALVPLSFFARFGDELELEPRLLAVPKTGPTESWALVAGKGALSGAASLGGWEISSRAGYAPGFVRNVVLEGWRLPDDVTVTFTSRILSSLRKAAAGEHVAVLLDGEQRAALDSLPFASELEVVFESEPLPAFVACAVDLRLAAKDADALFDALLELDSAAEGVDVLEQIRLVRFESLTEQQLDQIREAARRAAGS